MPKSKAKILIIEDEEALIKNLELALKDDYDILIAKDGKQGLKQAEQKDLNLILLDVMLPDISGIDILKKLKSNKATAEIPVIVFTNLSDQLTISKILGAGGKEYIVKSDWSIDEIAKKIKEII